MKSLIATFLVFFLSAGSSFAGELLEDFDDNKHEWQIEDDGVMGGVSQGKFSLDAEGVLVFEGNLSLENNGGFSSIQTESFARDLGAHEGVEVRFLGDGRVYQFWLSTDVLYNGREMAFVAEFPTTAGEWSTVKIPFESLKGRFRGQEVTTKTFDPAKVRRMRFLIADKKEGAFHLKVDFIKAY